MVDAERLSYRYQADRDPVLTQATVAIAADDKVLIEGPSGGGKSTLASLIVGGAGIAMLYSVANGHLHPWALRQIGHFTLGLIVLLVAQWILYFILMMFLGFWTRPSTLT